MTLGLAQFFTVKSAGGTTLYRWQNFWNNQTVDGHTFLPFQAEAIFSRLTPSSDSLSISLPISSTLLSVVEQGLIQYYVGVVDLYQFSPTAAGTPPATKLLVARYTGEFSSAEIADSSITLTIGSNLDSTESQVPLRKFTTTLAGRPPKL